MEAKYCVDPAKVQTVYCILTDPEIEWVYCEPLDKSSNLGKDDGNDKDQEEEENQEGQD